MTEELKALSGQGTEILKNLRWKDLIEFAETFGVAVEDVEKLPPSKQIEANAWLVWKSLVRSGKTDKTFEEFLEEPVFIEEIFRLQ